MNKKILKQKKHQLIRARREARTKKLKKWKDKRKAKRYLSILSDIKLSAKSQKSPLGQPRSRITSEMHRKLNYPDHQHIKAPSHFSFLNNTIDVLSFIKKLEGALDRRQKTFIVLEDVRQIDHTAIIVLLSIMIRFKKIGVAFNGNFPSNHVARQIFDESKFLEHLYDLPIKKLDKLIGGNSAIYAETSKTVNNELAKRLIKEASTTIWGEPKRCQEVYSNLNELMLNTHNHAEIGLRGHRNWYLVVTHIKDEKKVIFTFVDYGVGVINSLSGKKIGDKMFGFVDQLKQLFGQERVTNADVMKQIFLDGARTSSTGLSHRGYGLPSIYRSFLENGISNLHYITNNVHVDAPNNNFSLLSANFSGTFVYWELNESCNMLNVAKLPL